MCYNVGGNYIYYTDMNNVRHLIVTSLATLMLSLGFSSWLFPKLAIGAMNPEKEEDKMVPLNAGLAVYSLSLGLLYALPSLINKSSYCFTPATILISSLISSTSSLFIIQSAIHIDSVKDFLSRDLSSLAVITAVCTMILTPAIARLA